MSSSSCSKYRQALPFHDDGGPTLYIMEGGVSTSLIYDHGVDLGEHFSTLSILRGKSGVEAIKSVLRPFIDIARKSGVGLVLGAQTWRASPAWGEKMGISLAELKQLNELAVDLSVSLREEAEADGALTVILVAGEVGPRGDGYVADTTKMSPEDAKAYHSVQMSWLANFSKADFVNAFTLSYVEEAIGIAAAAKEHAMPIAIGFTVETDGCLPSGTKLCDAILQVDAATDCYPLHFSINCAHPSHFAARLITGAESGAAWVKRVKCIKPNSSRLSHAELDKCTVLDRGDPVDLANLCAELRKKLPWINVIGGCCGTNHVHVVEMLRACAPASSEADNGL
jgi:homocysteine S-methyltransferase